MNNYHKNPLEQVPREGGGGGGGGGGDYCPYKFALLEFLLWFMHHLRRHGGSRVQSSSFFLVETYNESYHLLVARFVPSTNITVVPSSST